MYALDTNTLIYYFKGVGRVAEHLLRTPPSEIAIPSIVLFELKFGIARSAHPQKRQKSLEDFITLVRILSFDAAAAQAATQIRLFLENQGNAIGPLDNLIAGTAQAYGATLVTHNTDEFSRVPHLKTVDWF